MRQKLILSTLALLALSSCAGQRLEEARQAVASARATCKAAYPPNTHYLDRTNCEAQTRRWAMQKIGTPGDLAELFLAKQAAIAAKIDAGQITKEQGNVEISTVSVELNQIIAQRNRSNALATAAILAAMPQPQIYQPQPYQPQPYMIPTQRTINTNCMRMGNMVNCTSN